MEIRVIHTIPNYATVADRRNALHQAYIRAQKSIHLADDKRRKKNKSERTSDAFAED